jgi:predicted RNase H-like HicB family nuclease
MNLQVEIEKEEDDRWIAEIPALPGVLVYGNTRQEAIARAKALALRVFADHLEYGENVPEMATLFKEGGVPVQNGSPLPAR